VLLGVDGSTTEAKDEDEEEDSIETLLEALSWLLDALMLLLPLPDDEGRWPCIVVRA